LEDGLSSSDSPRGIMKTFIAVGLTKFTHTRGANIISVHFVLVEQIR
jgi:hypothetical protein